MSEVKQETWSATLRHRLPRYLPVHMVAFGAAAALAAAIQIVAPVSFSLLKPLLIWSILLIAHYLYVRTLEVDPDWVEERSETITLNATDLSHIDDIKQRYEERERQFRDAGNGDDATRKNGGDPSGDESPAAARAKRSIRRGGGDTR